MIPIPETVLNVDDTESARYAKTRLLTHAGFDVMEASTGAEALDIVRRRLPSLVLLDVNLPDMSGIEVCRIIKRDHPQVLVLQTSAHFVSADHRVKGLEEGADAYLTQPAEPSEMIATVRALLRVRRAEERLRRSEARMRLAQQTGGVGTWEWDVDTGREVWSDHNYRLMGLPPDSEVSDGLASVPVHPDDRDRFQAALLRAVDGPDPLSLEYRVLHRDGTTHWILTRAERLGAGGGRKGRLVGINIDLTSQKQAEARQRVLIQELHHRVKNTLAIVQSIARQTLKNGGGHDKLDDFEMRLGNLARTHDLLMRDDMIGGTLRAIVEEAAAPYLGGASDRFSAAGPHVVVEPRAAVAIAMALHELATNAAKYGALSDASGHVEVSWEWIPGAQRQLRICWIETGGPAVTPPARHGFGSRLIERILAHELNGSATLDFRAGGVVCEIVVGSIGEEI